MVLKEYIEQAAENLFKCEICDKKLPDGYKYGRHLEAHEMKEERKRFKLKYIGEFSCKMHDIKWEFNSNRELQCHYHLAFQR